MADPQADTDFAGWIWAVVEVPVERYFGPAEKVKITLPRLLLAKIDRYAKAHGESRSGFLAEAACTAELAVCCRFDPVAHGQCTLEKLEVVCAPKFVQPSQVVPPHHEIF